MRNNIWIMGFLAVLLAAGCSKQEADEAYAGAAPPVDATAGQATAGEAKLASKPDSPPVTPKEVPVRAVIRNGSLSVRVDNVEKSEDKVGSIVAAVGGYVDSAESTDLASAAPQLVMKLRVPSPEFEPVMDGLEALGTRTAKKVSSEDVTANIVDMAARLKIMRAQEEVYRRMLSRASGNQELMEVQDKLMNLRGDIESLEAQHRKLSKLAALSTIDLTLTQSSEGAVMATNDPNWAKESWGSALVAMGNIARAVGSVLIWLSVFAPLWLPAILLARAWKRKSPERRPEPV